MQRKDDLPELKSLPSYDESSSPMTHEVELSTAQDINLQAMRRDRRRGGVDLSPHLSRPNLPRINADDANKALKAHELYTAATTELVPPINPNASTERRTSLIIPTSPRKASADLESVQLPSQEKRPSAEKNMSGTDPLARRKSKEDKPSGQFVDVLGTFSNYLITQGYKPLIHIAVEKDDPLIKGAKPVSNGRPKLSDKDANGMAGYFVGLGDTLYSIRRRPMLSAQNADNNVPLTDAQMKTVLYTEKGERKAGSFRELRDGSFVWVMMLIQTPENQLCIELRVIPYGQGGHISLTYTEEEKAIGAWSVDPNHPDAKNCVVGGGEGFKLKSEGGIILMPNKTGAYKDILKKLGIDQEALVKKFFDPYVSPLYKDNYFFDCANCTSGRVNVEILTELIFRGLPEELIPDDYKIQNPNSPNELKAWQQLTPALQERARQNSIVQNNFKEAQKKQSEKVSLSSQQKLGSPDLEKDASLRGHDKHVPVTTTTTTIMTVPNITIETSPALPEATGNGPVVPFGEIVGYQENSMFANSTATSTSIAAKPEQNMPSTSTDQQKRPGFRSPGLDD